jgi:hypothetical protein
VKRILSTLAFALLGAFALMGAYTSAPPVVVVYPLTVSAGANPEAGSNIAVLIAQGLAQHGVTVKPAPPGTQRADYLTAAQAAGADYYVTGFLSALGDEVSMVLQAVSTSSGSIVNSTTTVVKTYAEAAGQAEPLAQAILRHSGRELAELDEPRPSGTDTPQPSRSDKGNEANLTGLGAIFHHRPKATPTPAASPVAGVSVPAPTAAAGVPAQVALAPGQRVLVLQAGGDADAALAQRATRDVTAAAGRNGVGAQALPVSGVEGVKNAAEFCRNNVGTHGLYATTLTVQRNAAGQPTEALVDVVMYDCSGNAVERRHGAASAAGHGGLEGAVDRAIGSAFASAPSRG